MTGFPLLSAMLCIAVIVIGALVALVVILMMPPKNQTQSSTGLERRPRKSWKSWIPFLAIALLLMIWSGWISLLFLVTVWIMRIDPAPYQREIPYPSDRDRNSAKGLYAWLLLSPFITVPTMIVAALFLDRNSSTNERVFTALIPAIVHLLLLFSLDSKRPFVYRHTQQAIFLVALRAGMASIAMSISAYPGDGGTWLFFLGNGALWLFGSLWGRGQAVRRECWWMKRKGETIKLLEATPSADSIKAQTIEKPPASSEPLVLPKPANKTGDSFRQKTLHAFRTGTPEERKRAVHTLSQLGEVEKF